MTKSNMDLYLEYINKRGSCLSVFRAIADKYELKSGIYPGSYIHITPSLCLSEMYYVDSDKKAIAFFKHQNDIEAYLDKNKCYTTAFDFQFEGADFTKPLGAKRGYYDLMISLYSGFISLHCKDYLRKGGVLLANDSHGDATLAFYDPDYAFIGVLVESEKGIEISGDTLDRYFKMKSEKKVDLDKVKKQMKGPNYRNQVEYYLFQKKV
ncbi:hypothetical protein [Fusibacter ferrireducens]|uniref:Uncharacterized protein n=1 Tax=Fusibacter ferrireducens TaxID=2785058 RepID=A0ABR9ZM36_9FIRM|nr:hypothetical protein [Fusibacter ferrireducens]MBF4691528.1 hypothetical protein [Fusibacter ferrireducens]